MGLGTVVVVSVKVELTELAKTIEPYGFAYLVSVGDSGRAHVLAVTPVLDDDGLVVGGVGRHSQANASSRPDVTLVWPPFEPGGFSLLVDGTATVDGSTITVAPVKATLHRPAPGADGQREGSDCVAVPLEG
jgi:hypothetical protein